MTDLPAGDQQASGSTTRDDKARSRTRELLDIAGVVVYAALVLYVFAFIFTHPHTVHNRYTDSWWHISVAEEFADTGRFAGDPFLVGAPRYATFGLLDYTCGLISGNTEADAADVYVVLLAVGAAVSLGAAFAAGYVLTRRVWPAVVAGSVFLLLNGPRGLVTLGLPFTIAQSLLFLLLISLWHDRHYREIGVVGATWRGLLLGTVFCLHAFAGLAGLTIVACTIAICVARNAISRNWRAAGRNCAAGAVLALAFLLPAWQWIYLHIELRPLLSETNAHMLAGHAVQPYRVVNLALSVVVALGLFFGLRGRSALRGAVVGMAVLGFILLVCCLPAVNGFIASNTSWFMARRIPRLFPAGVVFGCAVWMAWDRVGRAGRKTLSAAAGVILLAIMCHICAPLAWRIARQHVYLLRTEDYNVHEYEFLRRRLGAEWRGRIILSDPTTSYFACGLVDTYAVTVPPGHASPAADYAARNATARASLAGGPARLGGHDVAGVVLETRKGDTAAFAGASVEDMIFAWTNSGWQIAVKTDDMILIVAPETTVK
jgi:hypothetical protein